MNKELKAKSKRKSKAKVLEEKLKEKDKLCHEYLDNLLRVKAEFENYKKRKVREKEAFLKYTLENFLGELLPALDDFERALASAKNSQDFPSFHRGVEMIHNQLFKVLEKEGLVRIEAKGKEFDPRFHEAREIIESSEYPENTVVEELLKGYKLKDKIIRPAVVKVAKHK
jgi:molecular chaperone GrpE